MDKFMNMGGTFIGPAPTGDDLAQLASQGVKTVVDFREPKEIDPTHKDLVAQHGMQYVNIPVSKTTFSDERVQAFAEALNAAPGGHLLHCASGARAGAMMLMVHATASGMSSREALDMAAAMGFDCDAHPEIKEFFTGYIDKHHPASDPA